MTSGLAHLAVGRRDMSQLAATGWQTVSTPTKPTIEVITVMTMTP